MRLPIVIRVDRSALLLAFVGLFITSTAVLHSWMACFAPTAASSTASAVSTTDTDLLSTTPYSPRRHIRPGAVGDEPPPRPLPVRNRMGLIVVFVHIPKTGGTSIRAGLARAADEFLFGLGAEACRKHVDTMYQRLADWRPGRFLLFELHTLTCPSYMAQRHHIEAWRALAARQGVPFFAFSMVREPFQCAVSWYQYYFGPVGFQHTLTEADFKASLVHNAQSLFLARSEETYRHAELRAGYNRQEFEAVSRYFLQDMDWIGTLEEQSALTQPILTQVVNRRLVFEHKNESPDTDFSKASISPATKAWVLKENAWDIELYEKVRQQFTGAEWAKRSWMQQLFGR